MCHTSPLVLHNSAVLIPNHNNFCYVYVAPNVRAICITSTNIILNFTILPTAQLLCPLTDKCQPKIQCGLLANRSKLQKLAKINEQRWSSVPKRWYGNMFKRENTQKDSTEETKINQQNRTPVCWTVLHWTANSNIQMHLMHLVISLLFTVSSALY